MGKTVVIVKRGVRCLEEKRSFCVLDLYLLMGIQVPAGLTLARHLDKMVPSQ